MPKFREMIGDIGRGFGEQWTAQEEEKRRQEAKRKEKEEETKFEIKKIILTKMAERGEIGLDLDSGNLIKTPKAAMPSNLEASSYNISGQPTGYKALNPADVLKSIISGTRPPEDIRKVKSEQEIMDMLPLIAGEHAGGGKVLAPQGTREEGGFRFSPQGDMIGEYSPGAEMQRGGLEMIPEILKRKDTSYDYERKLSEAVSRVSAGEDIDKEFNKLIKLYPLKATEIKNFLQSAMPQVSMLYERKLSEAVSRVSAGEDIDKEFNKLIKLYPLKATEIKNSLQSAMPQVSMLEAAKAKVQGAVNSIKTKEDLELFKDFEEVFKKEGINTKAVIKAAEKKFKGRR